MAVACSLWKEAAETLPAGTARPERRILNGVDRRCPDWQLAVAPHLGAGDWRWSCDSRLATNVEPPAIETATNPGVQDSWHVVEGIESSPSMASRAAARVRQLRGRQSHLPLEWTAAAGLATATLPENEASLLAPVG